MITQQEYEQLIEGLLKFYKKSKVDIPERILDADPKRITKIYLESYREILNYLVRELAYTGSLQTINQQTQLSLMMQIQEKLVKMKVKVKAEIEQAVYKQYVSGEVNHFINVNEINDPQVVAELLPLSQINFLKANQLIQDTMDDLLYATDFTEKSIKRVVKDTVAKHIQLSALQHDDYKNIKRNIVNDLTSQGLSKKITKEGFVGVIDKSGKKWGIQNYTDVVVKSKMHQAYTEGIKEQSFKSKKDLAIIPEKGAVDTCNHFEGMIISMTGYTKGYPTYDQLKATNLIFHPRCRHHPVPIGKIENLPQEDLEYHKQKVKDLKKLTKK